MSSGSQPLEKVMASLVELERELDELKLSVEKARKGLVETATRESAKLKDMIIAEARKNAEELVEKVKRDAETEADKIKEHNKENLKILEEKIRSSSQQAVKVVVATLTKPRE